MLQQASQFNQASQACTCMHKYITSVIRPAAIVVLEQLFYKSFSNVPAAIRLAGQLDTKLYSQAFNAIAKRLYGFTLPTSPSRWAACSNHF